MNGLIGFADAVREAVANGSDNWTMYGSILIRRAEKRPSLSELRIQGTARFRAFRADALYSAADRMTNDYREYLVLRSTMKRAAEKAAEMAAEHARRLRIAEYGRES